MSKSDLLTDIKGHADKVLQVCSYHRRDFDLVVVRSRPYDMQQIEASLQNAFDRSPTAELGTLGRLPPELISMILRDLDVRSFFYLRQVNQQARVLSTGLWEYRLVSTYGLEGLRGVLRAGLAHCFTINDLYLPLVTNTCTTCGNFGGHLFLFSAERCCFDCLQSVPHFRVLSISTFAKLAHMSSRRLSRLPGLCLRTVPGIYNMMEAPARRPMHLIWAEKATETLLGLNKIGEDTAQKLTSHREQPEHRFMVATAYPCYSLEDAKLDRGLSCKGCQVRLEASGGDLADRDRCFSSQGFLSHFSNCMEAQHLWTQSEGGSIQVDEPELTRRSGYFKQLGSDGLPA